MMRIFFLLCTLLFQTGYTFSLRDENITYELAHAVRFKTAPDWIKTSGSQDKKRGIEIVNLQRSAIVSDSGKKYVATQSCKVEKIPPTNIKNYSFAALSPFQKKKDFRIEKIITHTDGLLQLTYAIGYWAYYVDDTNKLHKLIIIHGIQQNNYGVQFFIDCPNEVFIELEEEITAEIRTLSFI